MLDAHTLGYSWSGNTISALFQPYALNTDVNNARGYAIGAALLYCLSLTWLFVFIANNSATLKHKGLIKTAGIGAMVYAFLIVTPMHNLMVNIALVFFVTAVLSILHSLYLLKMKRLFVLGIICNCLPIFNAVLYYSNTLYALLPSIQKLGMLACIIWLLLVYYDLLNSKIKAIEEE